MVKTRLLLLFPAKRHSHERRWCCWACFPSADIITTTFMTYDMFQEALLRLALTAFVRSSASADDKLRGLFTHMYKVVNRRENGVKAAWMRPSDNSRVKQRAGSLNTFGTGVFNERLLEMWSADNFKDYVFGVEEHVEEGAAVLGRIVLDGLQNIAIKSRPVRKQSTHAVGNERTGGKQSRLSCCVCVRVCLFVRIARWSRIYSQWTSCAHRMRLR